MRRKAARGGGITAKGGEHCADLLEEPSRKLGEINLAWPTILAIDVSLMSRRLLRELVRKCLMIRDECLMNRES